MAHEQRDLKPHTESRHGKRGRGLYMVFTAVVHVTTNARARLHLSTPTSVEWFERNS